MKIAIEESIVLPKNYYIHEASNDSPINNIKHEKVSPQKTTETSNEKKNSFFDSKWSLFGFNKSNSSKQNKNEENNNEKVQQQYDSTELHNAVSEAHERLRERGEKLNQLSDKTAKLNDTATEFSNMAKLLKKPKKSICCYLNSVCLPF